MEKGGVPVVELARNFTFSAAHRLHNPGWSAERNVAIFGKCNNANGHGHNYRVTVAVRGPIDAESGMVVNLSLVKEEISRVEAVLDHKHLDRDVAYFRDGPVVSTTENVAVFIWEQLQKTRIGPLLHRVTVWETDNNCFVYKGRRTA